MVITRFAPSPTGLLHVGNVRTALINWLFARASGGKFILRIDDTDMQRSKREYADAILRDLEWLGLYWDEIHYQSERTEIHLATQKRLIESGRLYPCFETQEELEIKKKIALSRNLPPIYDRSALKFSASELAELCSKTVPHYRFLMLHEKISWHDGIKGDIEFDGGNISDPVFVRADGSMTYMIATVADDIALGITDIIRGEDHITNSAVHLQMFEALGAQRPSLAHLALLRSAEGEISKRLGGFDIASLRESGMHPMAINSFLAKIGGSDSVEVRGSLQELVGEFSISKFSKSPTTYNLSELERLNERLIHSLSFREARPYLSDVISEEFWHKVRPNLKTCREAQDWWNICMQELDVAATLDLEFTRQAADLLPEGEINQQTWDAWIAQIKQATDRSGKNLFMPLRVALTGQQYGPELRDLLPILGRSKILGRLRGLKT
jgi:glutamyl-tRNA synthetase